MIINSQLGGKTPTGTKNITANGVYDVTDFASADVQVPTTAPAYYIEKTKDANNKLLNGTSVMSFAGLTDIGNYVFYYAYYQNTSITGAIDLSSLTTISGQYACESMFYNCKGLTSVDLSSLTTVSGRNACRYMFSTCTGITSVNLSSLTTISGQSGCNYMFYNCTGLTSVDLSSLTTVSGSAGISSMFNGCSNIVSVDLSSLTSDSNSGGTFSGCTSLTTVNLSSLNTIGNYSFQNMFNNCTSLTSLSFPALTSTSFGSYTTQFSNMLSGVTGCTVRFPSNLQSVIGSWASVTVGFSGTNTTVLFDLPATVTLTGADTVTYTRNPKYDTATALAWKVGAYGTTNFTPAYYTSGTTGPAVSATIYSDSACTTPVTTISSIA